MFFKLESNGFIICLGIILLLTGLIMFYVKQRFAVYDRIISEQNKLLKHVVASIEYSSVRNVESASELSSSIALQAAREASARTFSEINEHSTRISVSDDESSEEVDSESEDDDSESENSSENDGVSVESEPEYKKVNNQSQTKILKISNLEYLNEMKDDLSSSSIDNIDSDDDIDDSDSSQEDNNYTELRTNLPETFIKVIELKPDGNEHKEDIINNNVKNETDISELTQDNESLKAKINVEEAHEDVKHSISKKIDLANNLAVSTLNGLKKTELETLCKERKLSTKGTRLELIKRLTEL